MKPIVYALLFLLTLAGCQNSNTPAPASAAEAVVYSTGLVKQVNGKFGVMHWHPRRGIQGAMPDEYDSESNGGKTPVRNQGGCGCCWAFGGTQTMEIGTQMFSGKSIDYSEQDLCGKYFSKCRGGDFTGEYQVKYGQTDEASCPYSASSTRCPNTAKPVAYATNWGFVGQPDRSPTDEELQTSIQTYGSVAVYVSGGPSSFQNMQVDADGFALKCPSGDTDHIVTLVGWKTKNGKVYYKVKNSWGTKWVRGGYAYVPRLCWNLAERASWLSVSQVPCQPPHAHLPKESILPFNEELRLSVKPEQGVTYSWWRADIKLGDGPFLDLVAKETMVVKLKASNKCGDGEVISQVTVTE
jgi:hypothetical protein